MAEERWAKHVPKPVSVHAEHAPDWVGQHPFTDFLYSHGSRRNLRRILKFIHGKPRRDSTELIFMQADLVRARVNTTAQRVAFFYRDDGDDDDNTETVLTYDELVEILERHIESDGFPGRDTLTADGRDAWSSD